MSDEPKQWWQTLPAIIAGFATLLTAVTGLLVTLHQMGVFKLSDMKPQSRSLTPTSLEGEATRTPRPGLRVNFQKFKRRRQLLSLRWNRAPLPPRPRGLPQFLNSPRLRLAVVRSIP